MLQHLKGKEWNRGKQHVKNLLICISTREGRLTPTAPSYEDMRMETSLSMTTRILFMEGLSAAIGGTESEQVRSPIDDLQVK